MQIKLWISLSRGFPHIQLALLYTMCNTLTMTLKELIEVVKEKTLTKDQLEAYRDNLSHLFAQMQFEMADLEKEEAIFMHDKEGTVAQRKVDWKATTSGQRLITLKKYCIATKEILNSLKSRLYSFY